MSQQIFKLNILLLLVCETFHHSYVIEEDFADCVQVSQEVCKTRDGCPTVPKTQCQISKRNVTRAYPETKASVTYSHWAQAACYLRSLYLQIRLFTIQNCSKMTIFSSSMDFLSSNSEFAVQTDGKQLPQITRETCTVFLNWWVVQSTFRFKNLLFGYHNMNLDTLIQMICDTLGHRFLTWGPRKIQK